MTVLRVGLVVLFGAAVALPALFEIACFSSSGIAARAVAGEPEETRGLRERLADPPAASMPTRFGRLLSAGLAERVALREAGAS